MDAKVGDTVHVRGKYEAKGTVYSNVLFTTSDGCERVTVYNPDIVHVEPRALQVGDKVTRKTSYPMTEDGAGTAIGGILGLVDEYAWVFWRHRPVTVLLAELVRAE